MVEVEPDRLQFRRQLALSWVGKSRTMIVRSTRFDGWLDNPFSWFIC
jgi:hypothetical protein